MMMRTLRFAPLLVLLACGGAGATANVPAATAGPAPSGNVSPAVASAAPSTTAAPPKDAPATPAENPKVVTKVEVPPGITALVAAPDRSDDDKKLDAGRHPAEMLAFFGVSPGMHVGEIAAAGGYTTELLARAVGPTGVVYAENPKLILEKFAEKPWTLRLARPVNKHVVREDREPGDPFPGDVHDLDAVIDVLFYHDTVWLGADRDALYADVFRALKHGGVYGIVDHSGKDGSGTSEVKTLHRIEERTLREEIERAGFRLDSVATFLANPGDTRDWSASPMQAGPRRGTSDRFVLKFVKP